MTVRTEFSNWMTMAGQSFPGMIVRIENGSQVASFTVRTAVTGPSANDGVFSGSH